MPVINMHEAKTQLSRYVDQAASGEEIIIARAGKPGFSARVRKFACSRAG